MLVREEFMWEGMHLVKHYSDAGFLIHKIGTDEYYDEATDPIEFEREYEETDIPIEDPEEEQEEE